MMWKDGGNSEVLRSRNTSLCRVTSFGEYSNTAWVYNPIFYISKVCLCPTNSVFADKDPCPKRGENHSEVVITTPRVMSERIERWDRWDTRLPSTKDQEKVIALFHKSGAKTKSDFVRARLLDESFKIITVDKSAVEYYRKLSQLTAQIHKIGILYNQTVKAINSYHSVKAAQVMLQRLEQYSQQIITLEQQAISLTLDYRKR